MFVTRLCLNLEKYQTTINLAFFDQTVDEYMCKKQIVSQFLTFALANYLIQFISLMTE